MLRVNQLNGFCAGRGTAPALVVVQRLGLAAGLKLCLDAGDAASYAGSGQPWLDRSGGGYDFNRGATSGSEGSDPTFNGTAGRLSSGEYWSFDGGDYFRYDSANEAWMNNLHKDNALWTAIAWVRSGLGSPMHMLGNYGGSDSNIGVNFRAANTTTGTLLLVVANGSGTAGLVQASSGGVVVPANTWAMVSATHDEAGGATASFLGVNSTFMTFNGAVTSPSASGATHTMELGARGNASALAPSGSRMAMAAIWEGVALTQANVAAFFNATRGRFGV